MKIMYQLKKDLQQGIEFLIKKELENRQNKGNLTGSNALLFDGFNFEAEKSGNCPRIALLRRGAGIQEPKSIDSWISNNHGRSLEDLLRTILGQNYDGKEPIVFKEEEDALVSFEDENGEILLTARPDKVAYIGGNIYPIEVKTVQSNTTAYYVFIKNRPQLGALIQIAIYMLGNNVKEGIVLYCASNWFYGFAGKTMWKVTPGFKQINVTLEGGDLYFEGEKSIVSAEKIFGGANEFKRCLAYNQLPAKPQWLDASGELAKNSGCNFCFFNSVCEEFDATNNTNLSEFFTSCENKTKKIEE